MTAQVAVLVLNFNRGQDTLECLDSLLRLTFRPTHFVVCDNGSEDDSWAIVQHCAQIYSKSGPVRRSVPDCQRWGAVECLEYTLENAMFTALRSGSNLGFAGGNNIGLRYLLESDACSHVWLLNNDTLVEPDTLGHLLDALAARPGSGIACATIRYQHRPEIVLAYGGGRYYPLLGSTTLNGHGKRYSRDESLRRCTERRDFPLGASMLVTRDFLRTIGLLDERFFLYFEELDWVLRARGMFMMVYAPLSIVWHKEGASIGATQVNVQKKSLLGDYHFQRSRLLLSKKHFPLYFPFVVLSLVITASKRIYRGQWRRLFMLWQCLREVCSVPL